MSPGQRERVLVAGSSGPIGAAVATYLDTIGFEVVRLDRTDGRPSPDIAIDLCAEELDSVLQAECDSFGPFTHVIHVAGGAGEWEARHPLEFPPLAEARRTIEDNLVSALALARWTSTANGIESMVIVSSINGRRPFGIPAYSAGKAGLEGLVAASVLPLASAGVRINLLTLGTIDHEAVRRLHANDDHFDELLSKSPLGRFALLSDVCAAVEFLLTNRSMNGAELVVDASQRWAT